MIDFTQRNGDFYAHYKAGALDVQYIRFRRQPYHGAISNRKQLTLAMRIMIAQRSSLRP
jgi:hypothetical protein